MQWQLERRPAHESWLIPFIGCAGLIVLLFY